MNKEIPDNMVLTPATVGVLELEGAKVGDDVMVMPGRATPFSTPERISLETSVEKNVVFTIIDVAEFWEKVVFKEELDKVVASGEDGG